MKILMLTNTFAPHVGGVARSVESFAAAYRRMGHEVLVVAPRFPGASAEEPGVARVPTIQNFNGSDFSVPVPIPGFLAAYLESFRPDVVHSHHPFLLGDMALRIGAARALPVIFTHHTLYENYTHYVTSRSERMKRFVVELCTGYCNLCDAVIAPSESVGERLRELGVSTRIEVIPTGVDLELFGGGDGSRFRARAGIPDRAFVVGHVGRLAPEKNLDFLARALALFLDKSAAAVALIAGSGPMHGPIQDLFASRGHGERLFLPGVLERASLADLYAACDVFAFASRSETQGMVLTEALAAGVPLVALDGSGVREVVREGYNGRLLFREDPEEFAAALTWVAQLDEDRRERLFLAVSETARRFSMPETARRSLELYDELRRGQRAPRPADDTMWERSKRLLAEEWKIVKNIALAAGDAWLRAGSPNSGTREP